MSDEDLRANSAEIAGLGKLASRISQETLASHRYIGDHAGLGDTIPGQILQRLAPFVATFQEYTRSRQVHLASNCSYIGDELKKAAWLYADQEHRNYAALNAHTHLPPPPFASRGTSEVAAVGHVEDYYGAADYGQPDDIVYPPPNPAIDDMRDAIDEAAGWLGEIDRTIFELTDWSPLNEATIPISGNWNEIRRLGEAFQIAGDAMESAAEALDAGVRRVDVHWNGRAAQAFAEYSGRQVAAMYWEGPCGRTIAAVCETITDHLRSTVQTVVRKIVEMLEEEVQLDSGRGALKFLIKKVPVAGTAWQVESIVEICWKAMDLTMELVSKIEKVIDDFGVFLEAIADPEGQISRTVDERLRPLNDLIDNGKTAVEAGKTADITPVLRTPDTPFSVGDGTTPWQDA